MPGICSLRGGEVGGGEGGSKTGALWISMAKMSVASSPPRLRCHDRRMRQLARCYLSCCTQCRMPPLVLQSSTTHGIAQDDLPGIAPKVIADCTNYMEYSPYSLHRTFPLSLPSHNICKQIVFNINKHDFQHNGLLSHCLNLSTFMS